MADLTIDNAVADAEIGGGEKIPVSDGGNPRSVTTEKLKDFVLQRIAALTATQSVDANTDGVYLLKGGELKPVSAAVLAAAVLDYAFALTSVAKITGNEKVSVKDANSKKTISLDALKSWLQSDTVTKAELKTVQDAVANKVDAEDGKGLSSNDFTNADKEKIKNLAEPVQSDWDETDSSKNSFIKNKPKIPEPITVDQILDENSSNPVANSVVANALSSIENPESVKWFLSISSFNNFLSGTDPTKSELRVALIIDNKKYYAVFIDNLDSRDSWYVCECSLFSNMTWT